MRALRCKLLILPFLRLKKVQNFVRNALAANSIIFSRARMISAKHKYENYLYSSVSAVDTPIKVIYYIYCIRHLVINQALSSRSYLVTRHRPQCTVLDVAFEM